MTFVKNLRQRNLKLFGYICADCGKLGEDFHHIDVTPLMGHDRKGSYYRAMDVKLHPECYVLLCKKCHRKRHEKEGY